MKYWKIIANNSQWTPEGVIHLIKDYILVLGAAGAAFVFILFGWRKYNLEIAKLRAEVAKLKEVNRIYQPTPEEIDRFLQEAGKIPPRKFHVSGADDPLGLFGEELQDFVTRLAAYYGNPEAQMTIGKRRLWAGMNQRPDPYPAGYERHPNPSHIVSRWKHVREIARENLSPDTFHVIEHFLSRFPSE